MSSSLATALANALETAASALKDETLPFKYPSTGSSSFQLKKALTDAATQIKGINSSATIDALVSLANQALATAFPASQTGTASTPRVQRIGTTDEIRLTLDHQIKKNIAKLDFNQNDFKLLRFSTNGTPELTIKTKLDLTAGLDNSGNPYIKTNANNNLPELTVDVIANLSKSAPQLQSQGGSKNLLGSRTTTPTSLNTATPVTKASAKIGFVELSAKDANRKTKAAATFKVDITDSDGGNDGKLTNPDKLLDKSTYTASLDGKADVDLSLETKFDDLISGFTGALPFKPKLPSLKANLEANWDFKAQDLLNNPSFSSKGLKASLKKITLDTGSLKPFFKDVVAPTRRTALQIKPFIDTLTKPISGFKTIGLPETLVDLLVEINKITEAKRDNLKVVASALDYLGNLPNFGSGNIDLGDLTLISQGAEQDANNYDPATANYDNKPNNGLKSDGLNAAKTSGSTDNPSLTGGAKPIKFPLLDDPLNPVKLLLGQNVKLIDVNLPISLPRIDFEVPLGPVPIAGIPVTFPVKGSFEADIKLGFGYDTSGLNSFLKELSRNPASPSIQPERLLNGLYLSDNVTNKDYEELLVKASIGLGIEVGVFGGGVGIDGTIKAEAGVDLRDPNDDGQLNFNEFTDILSGPSSELPSKLLSLFELSGTIKASAGVYAKFFGNEWRLDTPDVVLLDLDDLNKPPLPAAPPQTDSNTPSIPSVISIPKGLIPNKALVNSIDFDNLYTKTVLNGTAANVNLDKLLGRVPLKPLEKLATIKTIVSDKEESVRLTSFIGKARLGLLDFTEASGAKVVLANNDNILYSQSLRPVIIRSGKGADWLQAGKGNADIDGGAGSDFFVAGSGNNILKGGVGNDYFYLGFGPSKVDGGDGYDVVSYRDSDGFVLIDLSQTGANNGAAKNDSYINVEQFDGTKKADTLIGNEGNNVFSGGGGQDKLSGRAGNDVLLGGAAADLLDGGDGIDAASYTDAEAGVEINLLENTARDLAVLEEPAGGKRSPIVLPVPNKIKPQSYAKGDSFVNIENIMGSAYDDILIGNNTSNGLVGFNGDDELFGGAGNDKLDGGAGNDRLQGCLSTGNRGAGEKDLLFGSQGRDNYVLGDKTGSFYFGDRRAGFATIEGLEKGDQLTLAGSKESYQFLTVNGGVEIFNGTDLIAIVADTNIRGVNSSLSFV